PPLPERARAITAVTAESRSPTKQSIPRTEERTTPWLSVRLTRTRECRERSDDKLYVVEERPVGDVQIVQPDHLLERNLASSHHLPWAGTARLEVEALPAPGVDVTILVQDERPRPHQTHLAADHIEQLRELVERVAA